MGPLREIHGTAAPQIDVGVVRQILRLSFVFPRESMNHSNSPQRAQARRQHRSCAASERLGTRASPQEGPSAPEEERQLIRRKARQASMHHGGRPAPNDDADGSLRAPQELLVTRQAPALGSSARYGLQRRRCVRVEAAVRGESQRHILDAEPPELVQMILIMLSFFCCMASHGSAPAPVASGLMIPTSRAAWEPGRAAQV